VYRFFADLVIAFLFFAEKSSTKERYHHLPPKKNLEMIVSHVHACASAIYIFFLQFSPPPAPAHPPTQLFFSYIFFKQFYNCQFFLQFSGFAQPQSQCLLLLV
jgi:hypothetical protein